mmetsp:Transcript_33159/g.57682  ORF Transcript_33159/g.57682 Transcript_33159/m.57682 type:complete len:244 (+) Transcript_33159:353-1084(+)
MVRLIRLSWCQPPLLVLGAASYRGRASVHRRSGEVRKAVLERHRVRLVRRAMAALRAVLRKANAPVLVRMAEWGVQRKKKARGLHSYGDPRAARGAWQGALGPPAPVLLATLHRLLPGTVVTSLRTMQRETNARMRAPHAAQALMRSAIHAISVSHGKGLTPKMMSVLQHALQVLVGCSVRHGNERGVRQARRVTQEPRKPGLQRVLRVKRLGLRTRNSKTQLSTERTRPMMSRSSTLGMRQR